MVCPYVHCCREPVRQQGPAATALPPATEAAWPTTSVTADSGYGQSAAVAAPAALAAPVASHRGDMQWRSFTGIAGRVQY